LSVQNIIAKKIIPASIEFLDQATMEVVEAYAHIGLPSDMRAMLIIEQDGPESVVAHDIEKMKEICLKQGAVEVQIAQTKEEANNLMAARRSALSALARKKPTTILEDATVPRA